MIVAPRADSFWATSWPIPPRPTTSTVISESCLISHRPVQLRSRCWVISRGRSFAPAQHAEDGELRQRSAVHTSGRGEQDPAKLLLGKSGGLHLAAATGSHGVHPAEGDRVRGALQRGRIHVGYPVQRLGRVKHLLKRPLLSRGTPKRRVTGKSAG